jgi:hypothetical protein
LLDANILHLSPTHFASAFLFVIPQGSALAPTLHLNLHLHLSWFVSRRHPERSEGPPYSPLHLPLLLPLPFFLSFPQAICFYLCL